jgi:hypothetical protein
MSYILTASTSRFERFIALSASASRKGSTQHGVPAFADRLVLRNGRDEPVSRAVSDDLERAPPGIGTPGPRAGTSTRAVYEVKNLLRVIGEEILGAYDWRGVRDGGSRQAYLGALVRSMDFLRDLRTSGNQVSEGEEKLSDRSRKGKEGVPPGPDVRDLLR